MNLSFIQTTSGMSEACERVRTTVLFILDSIRKDRHYLNKHFQQAMSAYFLRNLCFPLLSEDIQETSSSKMHMSFAKKYSREEGSDYLRLMNGYALEISNNGKQDMYRKQLIERVLLVFENELPLENLTANKKLSGQIWFRAFSLFLLFHSYNPRVEGILEIWTALFPSDPIYRCRKQNINHTIPIRGLNQKKYINKLKTEKIPRFKQSNTQKVSTLSTILPTTQKAARKQIIQEQFIEKEFTVQQRPQTTQFQLAPQSSSFDSNFSSTGNQLFFFAEQHCEQQRNSLEKIKENRQSLMQTQTIELTKQTNKNPQDCKESNSCQPVNNLEMHTLLSQQPQLQSQFPHESYNLEHQCLINPLQKQHSFLKNTPQNNQTMQPPEQQIIINHVPHKINQPNQMHYPYQLARQNQLQQVQQINQERPSGTTFGQMIFENSSNNVKPQMKPLNLPLSSNNSHLQPQKIVSNELQKKINPQNSRNTNTQINSCLIPISSKQPLSTSLAEIHSSQLISSQQLLSTSSFQQVSQQFKEQHHKYHEQPQYYQQILELQQSSPSLTNIQNNEYLWDSQFPANVWSQAALLQAKSASQLNQIQQQPIENSEQEIFQFDYNQNQSYSSTQQGQYYQIEQPLFMNRSSRSYTQSQIYHNQSYLE